jgi:hypothetical protein
MKSGKGWAFLAVVLLLAATAAASAQEASPKVRLLLVDETKTLENSMRVQVLASLAKKTGQFELSARFADVVSSFDHPLAGKRPDAAYDVVVVFPKGLDDGTVNQVWILTRPIDRDMRPEVKTALAILHGLGQKVFPGVPFADVTQDLIPGYFAALLIQEGWL